MLKKARGCVMVFQDDQGSPDEVWRFGEAVDMMIMMMRMMRIEASTARRARLSSGLLTVLRC